MSAPHVSNTSSASSNPDPRDADPAEAARRQRIRDAMLAHELIPCDSVGPDPRHPLPGSYGLGWYWAEEALLAARELSGHEVRLLSAIKYHSIMMHGHHQWAMLVPTRYNPRPPTNEEWAGILRVDTQQFCKLRKRLVGLGVIRCAEDDNTKLALNPPDQWDPRVFGDPPAPTRRAGGGGSGSKRQRRAAMIVARDNDNDDATDAPIVTHDNRDGSPIVTHDNDTGAMIVTHDNTDCHARQSPSATNADFNGVGAVSQYVVIREEKDVSPPPNTTRVREARDDAAARPALAEVGVGRSFLRVLKAEAEDTGDTEETGRTASSQSTASGRAQRSEASSETLASSETSGSGAPQAPTPHPPTPRPSPGAPDAAPGTDTVASMPDARQARPAPRHDAPPPGPMPQDVPGSRNAQDDDAARLIAALRDTFREEWRPAGTPSVDRAATLLLLETYPLDFLLRAAPWFAASDGWKYRNLKTFGTWLGKEEEGQQLYKQYRAAQARRRAATLAERRAQAGRVYTKGEIEEFDLAVSLRALDPALPGDDYRLLADEERDRLYRELRPTAAALPRRHLYPGGDGGSWTMRGPAMPAEPPACLRCGRTRDAAYHAALLAHTSRGYEDFMVETAERKAATTDAQRRAISEKWQARWRERRAAEPEPPEGERACHPARLVLDRPLPSYFASGEGGRA